jgi:bifunctional ADP-heptose synthase (sugar kinase/adenylyltransferase)
VFSEDTPLELVRHLQPDVIVKGGDYTEDTIVGAADVRSRGGRVVIVPLTPGQSTTTIINKLGEAR